jgi:7,8-dihydropterin-6-yl-methyl-4-(beta-D-ribofuranosyl)aminobenzene 5'-phosphate synthase
LVYKATNGFVIITGCSHAGICNIIDQAKRICDENRIFDIIGGSHLLAPDKEQSEINLMYFRNLYSKKLHTCYCFDLPSKIALSTVANLVEVRVGLLLE